MPAALLRSFERWGAEQVRSPVVGCVTLVFVGLFVGAMPLSAGRAGLLETLMG